MVNKKVGEQNNSKDKIISLKDNRSNSHKNTNNEIKTNIIYSPSQGNNRSKNIIYLKKDRNKNELLNSENVIKNSVNNGIFKISKAQNYISKFQIDIIFMTIIIILII